MHELPRRDALKAIAGTTTLLSFGVGSVAARQKQGASADDTIFDLVEASDDFDILELALEETGLDGVFGGDGAQYTVFAPTDDAFVDLLADLGITPADLLANPDLADILSYHATNGRRYARSVVRAPRIRMLNGGQATIVDTDVEASNGVVHVLDGVLLPP